MSLEIAGIFFAEALFVTVMTCRWIILVKGNRMFAAFASFFEQMLNVLALGMVVSHLDSPIRILAFGLGYAVGSLSGSWMEEKLAIGYIMFQIIASPESKIPEILRNAGVGVTVCEAKGNDSAKILIVSVVRRRWAGQIAQKIEETDSHAFVVRTEPQALKGGYLLKSLRAANQDAIRTMMK
ncbi:Uncharacterized protein YebE, UPF0316 family [Paenibacillus sp. yr247]|uniref:DUF2179 domain-containing protein n=1 Tax=Paenibacillus sp. yr247 TaxID=1761880 RepID=UPI00088AC482|nr:DUF5698 domain-containing protein [Paenibacillus sp. yr247]SDO33401.1 Uncharacterized protein YebE, UPF0316 family [Paenibacillus sp. yr247]